MDVAEVVFRVGVGVGALLIGIGLLALVLAIGPLSNDARSLANDVRRLTRLVEKELPRLLERGRTAPVEPVDRTQPAEPPATGTPPGKIAPEPAADPSLDWIGPRPPGRPASGPVQSADQREDEQIA
jgi:hypothetical protein